jgi:hypothetical protein
VYISSASEVRYIDSLECLAAHRNEEEDTQAAQASLRMTNDPAKCDKPDTSEETKFVDGPSPEAVIVDKLLQAVNSTSDKAAVCPILKALVQTGARDLLWRVHARLVCMGERIRRRGKVSMAPSSSSSSLGPEAAPLVCFLQESVGRSSALIETFKDLDSHAFSQIDDASLTPDQRSTVAALFKLSALHEKTPAPGKHGSFAVKERDI